MNTCDNSLTTFWAFSRFHIADPMRTPLGKF
jgi:hypothetical protein